MSKKPLAMIVTSTLACPFLDSIWGEKINCMVVMQLCLGMEHPKCPLNENSGVWVRRQVGNGNDGS